MTTPILLYNQSWTWGSVVNVMDSQERIQLRNKINPFARFCFQHPNWEKLRLYLWMKKTKLCLSKVYTTLEIEEDASQRTLRDYRELFQYLNKSNGSRSRAVGYGPRILVQGKPGIGKTTFIHKVALDWANEKLDLFDSVFVVKLRDLNPDQPISNAIMLQHGILHGHGVNEDTISRYCDNSILLILDGLDEIDLKKYPQVQGILSGQDYPACNVMVTTRPHIPPKVRDDMKYIASIIGFSEQSAEKYVSHLIPDEDIRKEFFALLSARKMEGMYKIPIILQALALLFEFNRHKLPETYTATFEQLLDRIYVQKVRAGENCWSEEQIKEALKLTNEMAFKGLMQDQLVFPRDVITNEDVLRLGILSMSENETPFGSKSSLQFGHKTIQEFSASDFMMTEFTDGNRKPWEDYKHAVRKLLLCKEEETSRNKKGNSDPSLETGAQKANVVSATIKFIQAIMDSPEGKEAAIKRLTEVILAKGWYRDEPDKATLLEVTRHLPEVKRANLSEAEINAFFDFGMYLLSLADSEQKRKMQVRAKNLLKSNLDAKKLALILWLMSLYMKKDPAGAIEVLTCTIQSLFSCNSVVVNKKAQWLQEKANSVKLVFRFVLGKLRRHQELAEEILWEIADMLVDHAFDSDAGEAMWIHFLTQYLFDLMQEAGLSQRYVTSAIYSSDTVDFGTPVPKTCIVHINDIRLASLTDITRARALKVENIGGNLRPLFVQLEQMSSLKLLEVQKINSSRTDHCKELATALSSLRSVVSVVLNDIDNVTLCSYLLRNIPRSASRLTILSCAPVQWYRLPPRVHLQHLHIADSVSGVAKMFRSSFPNLKRLVIMGLRKWKRCDIASLYIAVKDKRMPQLQHLCIRFSNLRGHGWYLLQIIRASAVEIVDLMDTNLSKTDGQFLLDALKNRQLPNLQSLNLLHNPDINELVSEFDKFDKWCIDIQCSDVIRRNTVPWYITAFNTLCRGTCTIL